MALSGDLKDFGLLQLLTLVQVTGKTGALTLHRSDETATVYFESGQLTKVKVADSRPEGLAVALHRAGRIDREQFDLVGSHGLPPAEKTVALLLVDQGILSQEEVVDFVRERIVAGLYSLLTWPDGTFRLELGHFAPEEDIVAPTELSPVLERGQSYLNEWRLLAAHIPDLDRPLRLLPEPHRQLQEVSLGPAEWRMVASLAGSITLRDVAQKLALDEFAVRRVAYHLIDSGLAEIAEPETVSPVVLEETREVEAPRSGGISRLFGPLRR